MPSNLHRAFGRLLPLSLQRRRITHAVELALTDVDLYVTVSHLHLSTFGRQLTMELRAPVAVPPTMLEAIRGYIAQRLQELLGLQLQPQQIYLVSLPPHNVQAAAPPSTGALRRAVQLLQPWAPRTAPSAPPAANDSRLDRPVGAPVVARRPIEPSTFHETVPVAAQARQVEAVDLNDEDPRWASRNVEVQEFSPSDIAAAFAATVPAEIHPDATQSQRQARSG
ncbi:hypothetical protein [Ramlibacter sp. AN1133]|uniref:hypothetical protein n=1 Tax=Ramlibacter sp. AN1133 TaxID=3133429 RepID=UPI0030BB3451